MSTHRGPHGLERVDIGGVTVVRFHSPHLRGEAPSREAFGLLHGLVDEAGRRQLVLNLGPVETLDSYAASKLVLLNRKAQAAGGRLILCRLSPGLNAAFTAMNLLEAFDVCGEEEEAVQALVRPSPAEYENQGG
jgi:anti-anti-sigma regulatory factor